LVAKLFWRRGAWTIPVNDIRIPGST
jgi:hypothetical protein